MGIPVTMVPICSMAKPVKRLSASLSFDNTALLAASSDDGSIFFFHAVNHTLYKQITAHRGQINKAGFNSAGGLLSKGQGGSRLASVGCDGQLRIWKTEGCIDHATGKAEWDIEEHWCLDVHSSQYNPFAWHPYHRDFLAANMNPGHFQVFDTHRQVALCNIALQGTSPVLECEFAGDESCCCLLVSQNDGTLSAWDYRTGRSLWIARQPSDDKRNDGIVSIQAEHYGEPKAYTVDRSGSVEIWNVAEGRRIQSRNGRMGDYQRLAYDGGNLVHICSDNVGTENAESRVALLDPDSGEVVWSTAFRLALYSVACQGSMVAFADSSGVHLGRIDIA
jgi:WD40 repeat protein